MRKFTALLVALLLAAGLAAVSAEPANFILYTVYEQMGWGDAVQVGCVDENGGLWTLEGSAAALDWPYKLEDQLTYLAETDRLQQIGTLDRDDLIAIESLTSTVEDQYERATPAANDAGTEISYALQYDRDGACTAVRLGMSGDDMFENTDPGAQALYAALRTLFPNVTCFRDGMGPVGFQPVSVVEFLGLDPEAIRKAQIVGYYMDCEEGPIELDEDVEFARDIALNGVVTGKANAIATDGDIYAYNFLDGDGQYVGSIDLYGGLLVRGDGMYRLE